MAGGTNYGGRKGYFISEAWYLPGPDKPWVKVLDEAGPAEIFVPYQNNAHRFSDLIVLQLQLEPLIDAISGTVRPARRPPQLGGPADRARDLAKRGCCGWRRRLVVVRRQDRFPRTQLYRGHKMTLWAVVEAWNYRYILSYAFHDDGSIDFRAGATGTNFPGSERIAHTHNVLWRLNLRITEPVSAAARPTST